QGWHLHGHEPVVVHRRQARELPVRLRDRLADQGRPADRRLPEPHLHGHYDGVLGILRRRRRARCLDRVGHAELRQGPADAGGPRRARHASRTLPQRPRGGALMPGLLGADDARAVSEAALEVPGADTVEVLLMHEWGGLTRFANSAIHQSTGREDTGVRVRVVTEARTGVTATNDFSKEGARSAAASALEMARVAAPDPLYPGLAQQAPAP